MPLNKLARQMLVAPLLRRVRGEGAVRGVKLVTPDGKLVYSSEEDIILLELKGAKLWVVVDAAGSAACAAYSSSPEDALAFFFELTGDDALANAVKRKEVRVVLE